MRGCMAGTTRSWHSTAAGQQRHIALRQAMPTEVFDLTDSPAPCNITIAEYKATPATNRRRVTHLGPARPEFGTTITGSGSMLSILHKPSGANDILTCAAYNDRGSLGGGRDPPPPNTFTAGSGRKELDFSGILATPNTVLGPPPTRTFQLCEQVARDSGRRDGPRVGVYTIQRVGLFRLQAHSPRVGVAYTLYSV